MVIVGGPLDALEVEGHGLSEIGRPWVTIEALDEGAIEPIGGEPLHQGPEGGRDLPALSLAASSRGWPAKSPHHGQGHQGDCPHAHGIPAASALSSAEARCSISTIFQPK